MSFDYRRRNCLPTPAALFRDAVGAPAGVWYDPSDMSTMFQDSAGTTPVTAAGDPVGLINDKSPNGVNASQATAGSRSLLQQDASGFWYLDFDGTDDFLSASLDMSGTDKVTAIIAMRKDSDAAEAWPIGHNENNNSSFSFRAPNTALADDYRWVTKGTSLRGVTPSGYAAPTTNILSARGDISGDSALLRIDGAQVGESTGDQGTGNYANATLYLGQRGNASAYFNGRIYGLVIVGRLLSDTEIAKTEAYMARKCGVTLS